MNTQLTKTDAIRIARALLHSCLRTAQNSNANGTIFGTEEGWTATIGERWIVRLSGGGALLGPVEAATPVQPEPANNERHIAAAEAHDSAATAHEERRNAEAATAAASTATMAAPRCSASGAAANAECEALLATDCRIDEENRAADAAHDRAAQHHRDAATAHREAALAEARKVEDAARQRWRSDRDGPDHEHEAAWNHLCEASADRQRAEAEIAARRNGAQGIRLG